MQTKSAICAKRLDKPPPVGNCPICKANAVDGAETGVKAFLFLSFSFFSDKQKERYEKSIFMIFRGSSMAPTPTR